MPKTYGGRGDDKDRDIVQTNDGGYAITRPSMSADGVTETFDGKIVVIGETESNDKDITSNKGGKDIWVVKIR